MRSKVLTLVCLLLLLPFDFLAAACLGASMPFCLKSRRRKTRRAAPPLRVATIVIVNWDGKHLLAECLPSVIEAVKYTGGGHRILLVDNGSSDGSVEFVRETFPEVEILALDRNYGFSEGNNRGAAIVNTDLVVFLNNDMVVEKTFLRPLLDGFEDGDVFAVTSQIFFADASRRREETGKTRARFENGWFYLWHDDVTAADQTQEAIPVFWAGGGSCAVDRAKYLSIGGFDSLYHPFYVEDADLSYQAWKRGWKCILAPSSRVVHKHRSTTQRKFGRGFVENTIRRNQYLFVWKNVTDPGMLFDHLVHLPRIHARGMRTETPGFEMRGFLRALWHLPQALRRRVTEARVAELSDREVLARSQASGRA